MKLISFLNKILDLSKCLGCLSVKKSKNKQLNKRNLTKKLKNKVN